MQHMPDPLDTKNRQYMQRQQNAKRMQRTQPAMPGAHFAMSRVVMPETPIPAFHTHKSPQRQQKQRALRHAVLRFLLLGVILECLFLALYPLFVYATPHSDVLQNALLSFFPGSKTFYWSGVLPFLASLLAPFPWLHPDSPGGDANLQLLVLAFACLMLLLAFTAGWQVAKERLTPAHGRILFWIILLFAVVFGSTLLFAPVSLTASSQDTLLYGLYGRIVVFYHANPYVVAPIHTSAATLHDTLLSVLGPQVTGTPMQLGPIWADASSLMALLTGNSFATSVIGFRLLGLVVHCINVALLWTIVTKMKPAANSTGSVSSNTSGNAMCITATLLYAWNPLVLLYSIPYMHADVVVVLFLLLALFFFQRGVLTVGWVFTLLAALVNPLCLLLLPIFFRLMLRQSRVMRIGGGGHLFRWIGMLGISALVVGLVYAPYWQDWSVVGILATVSHAFIQDTAIHSVDAALLHLPVQLPDALQWVISPAHWSVFVLAGVGLFLLFATWLADTFEIALLFNSWLLLLLVALLPIFWPWSLLPLLALALCAGNQRTLNLVLLLCLSGIATYYSSLWPLPWATLGLVTIGLPLLLWGWLLFFTSTWQMTSKVESEQPRKGRDTMHRQSITGFSRPPWLSRPSHPGKGHYL